ncbi:MAG: rplF [Gammaproteobacteria bacterium]|nr:MAG: rplF [Gammaproteobacteria bacterium]TND06596.1 MAG: rplF [Gammaproteobacteria bacterium]
MARTSNQVTTVAKGVDVAIDGQLVRIKGPKGQLEHLVHEKIAVGQQDSVLNFSPRNKENAAVALAGTTCALIKNMMRGVTTGFEKKLTLIGVGYRAQAQGKKLNLTLGFSHPVSFEIPNGITIDTPSQTEIIVKGIDKQQVGQVAATIRGYRPPEPYKGKGVRYADEKIILKEAKKK